MSNDRERQLTAKERTEIAKRKAQIASQKQSGEAEDLDVLKKELGIKTKRN